MEAFLIYQLKVAVLTAVLVLLYRVFLKKQTFHRFNRAMLILIAVLSITLPAIRISALRADMPIHDTFTHDSGGHQFWVIGLIAAYCTGMILFVVRYIKSMKSVARLIDSGLYADRRDGCDVIESDAVSQPMNWMRYVVMPREWLESDDMSMAWKHEYLHASRLHSLDLLLADALWAMQWFNPAMKLLHAEIELIHEYEADRAVLDSGTDPTGYKLMLVDAVAQKKGISMGNWLGKSKLKNRMDMMERKESGRWNRLRALFIPAVAFLFLYANAQTAPAQDEDFQEPVFQDGKVWVFKDGTAKVETSDHVSESMKTDDVAAYLKSYDGCRTTRMTLMYMYPIQSLAQAQPLAEQLAKAGIRINVANNDEMLEHMEMPEFRLVRIYGPESDGKYRFEMICNMHEERIRHAFDKKAYSHEDLSISGDVRLMLKWIDLFDGHGLAIYPSDRMPVADLQKFADAAWKRGIEQVSVVQTDVQRITLIPQGTEMDKLYGNDTAVKAVERMNAKHTVFPNAVETIKKPESSYNPGTAYGNISRIVRCKNKTAIVYTVDQAPDMWLKSGMENGILKSGGREYHQTGRYGLEGFSEKYFWSPDWGRYVMVDYYPALPADVMVADLCDADGEPVIRNLQLSNAIPEDFYDSFVTMPLKSMYLLKTLKQSGADGGYDCFSVNEIEFNGSETVISCEMELWQPRSFKGYVNDFRMIFPDGTETAALRIDGVPAGRDFDRGGDYVKNYFRLVFPKLDPELFSDSERIIRLTGNVCHEPIGVELWNGDLMKGYESDAVRSYVAALDSFATVMPLIGGDTESDWAADCIHAMARRILEGNMDFHESMCRIYQIQNYLAYGMTYPLAIFAMRTEPELAKYALDIIARDDSAFTEISNGRFSDMEFIRTYGFISFFNIQLYYHLYDRFMKEDMHKDPLFADANLGLYQQYLDILDGFGDWTPLEREKTSAAFEGAMFFHTFYPMILANAPSREYALQIMDYIMEAADFFDEHSVPFFEDTPQPMSDSEYKAFLIKATEYKTALLGMLTREIGANAERTPENEIRKRVSAIYSHVLNAYVQKLGNPGNILSSYSFDSLYFSKDLLHLQALVHDLEDQYGDPICCDCDHWIQAQDFDHDLAARVLDVNMTGKDKAVAGIIIRNFGTDHNVTLSLVRERGDWFIDDMETSGNTLRGDMLDGIEICRQDGLVPRIR